MTKARYIVILGALALGVAISGCGAHATHTAQSATAAGSTAQTGPPLHASGSPAVVVSGLPFPANLAFDATGRLWITSATLGPAAAEGIWFVPPGGRPRHVAGSLTAPTALRWVGNQLYVGNLASPGTGEITILGGFTGSAFNHRRVLVGDLSVGRHTIGSIAPGPDGRLYSGLGAAGDHSGPPGHIVSFSPNGGKPVVVATGIGSAFGLAFWGRHLLAGMSGPDHVGAVPDQLQSFEPRGRVVDFGFPKCYGQGGTACATYPAPLAKFPAHSTPVGVAVKGNVAFVAENGSAVPNSPASSNIARVDLHTGRVTLFWHSPVPHDPVGLAIGPDGNLYATLFASGKIVRFDL
jgi:glucose/arabinose dehydrogenase